MSAADNLPENFLSILTEKARRCGDCEITQGVRQRANDPKTETGQSTADGYDETLPEGNSDG
jgi:hypothetical protein